jgi:hypothetical protein
MTARRGAAVSSSLVVMEGLAQPYSKHILSDPTYLDRDRSNRSRNDREWEKLSSAASRILVGMSEVAQTRPKFGSGMCHREQREVSACCAT